MNFQLRMELTGVGGTPERMGVVTAGDPTPPTSPPPPYHSPTSGHVGLLFSGSALLTVPIRDPAWRVPFQEAGSESIRICLATHSGCYVSGKIGSAVSQKSLGWGHFPGPPRFPQPRVMPFSERSETPPLLPVAILPSSLCGHSDEAVLIHPGPHSVNVGTETLIPAGLFLR